MKRKVIVNNKILEKEVEEEQIRGGTAYQESILAEKFCDLERIDISVSSRSVKAFISSGTEITIIRRNISDFELEDNPSIFIKGIFSPAEKCPLV